MIPPIALYHQENNPKHSTTDFHENGIRTAFWHPNPLDPRVSFLPDMNHFQIIYSTAFYYIAKIRKFDFFQISSRLTFFTLLTSNFMQNWNQETKERFPNI